jgi:hypothetical protein
VDVIATAYYGPFVPERPLLEKVPDTAKEAAEGKLCPECKKANYLKEACPRCHCPFPLADWRQRSVTTVAMAGAKTSGKSVYLAVMVEELKKHVKRFWRNTVLAVDDADPGLGKQKTEERYETYYRQRLYVARGMPEGTKDEDPFQRDPLIYELGTFNGQNSVLVLRDVAGEALEKVPTDPPPDHWTFLKRADGVLFLYDIENDEHIREYLENNTDFDLLPRSALGREPSHVLNQVLKLIGEERPRFGLILSKFDYVQALPDLPVDDLITKSLRNKGAAFNREPEISGDPDDFLLLHQELTSLLDLFDASSLIYAIQNQRSDTADHFALFAVSSLGEPVIGKQVSSRGITPFRILDPILWLLSYRWNMRGEGLS